MTIREGTTGDAGAVARLHAVEIAEGFLATMGPRFLTRLYREVVRWPGAFLLVADEEGEVVGLAAGADDVAGLYRSFLLHQGPAAAVVAAPRLLRSWPRVLETLRYPAAAKDLPRAELLAVAVARHRQGQGLGQDLVGAAMAEFRRRGVGAARVVAGAGNDRALRLYRSCGFRPAGRMEVHRGTASEVLTWS